MSKQYRYPGVTPFTRAQRSIFFGREEDVRLLHKRIQREPLVVLHGKSGLGKSSIINAGIIPVVEEQSTFEPLLIRFGAKTTQNDDSLLAKTKNILNESSDTIQLLERLLPNDDSLWTHAKTRQMKGGSSPLLIFDQFEELFSYPEEEIQAFEQGLVELLYTDIPLRFRRQLERLEEENDISDEEEELLEQPLQARILFAIRSDRLHLLNRIDDYFPNILRNCYELQALLPEDARAAIVKPALMEGNFQTDPFTYSKAALERLLNYLKDKEDQRVEGILIQMLCEHYEKKEVEANGYHQLDLPQIGDPDEVVKNYYEEKIQALPTADRMAARKLIEDGLVSEGEGMRLTLHETFIIQQYEVTKALLENLVDNRLLRPEPFLRGGFTYELSHDRLIPAVTQARRERRVHEAELTRQAEAERLRQQAEQDRLEKEKAKRRLRLVGALLTLAVVALLVAVYFGWRANAQKVAAENARQTAQDNLINAYQADIQRYETEMSIAKRNIRSFRQYNAEEDVFQLEEQKIQGLEARIDSLENEIKTLQE